MRVPVRRLPQTRVSEGQQAFARPAPALDISPLTDAVTHIQDQLWEEQRDRQRFTANRRLMQEVNELQTDFEERRRDPNISPIDFAATTNQAYEERHRRLVEELRGEHFDEDILEDLDTRLGAVRQGMFERGLGHQIQALASRANTEADELGVHASQYVAANPDGYASAERMINDSISVMPDLTEAEREAKRQELLGILRNAGARALAIQNPQLIIDAFDPQGFTAPAGTRPATAGGAVNTEGLDANRATVASTLAAGGLSPQVVAGFLGNFDVENGYEGAQGDGGSASGIAQWRLDRRENFRRQFGHDPHEGTMQEQAEFVLWELDHPAEAGMSQEEVNAIRNARTAEEAAALIDEHFEGSTGQHRSRRIEAASHYAGTVQPVAIPPSTVATADTQPPEGVPQPIIPGNLPLDIQQVVHNDDGTVSTVRTISIGVDGREVLIPTVIDGRVVGDDEAAQHYYETGENFGTFENAADATAYGEALHQSHEQALRPPQNPAEALTGNALLDALNGPERLQALSWAREQQNRNNVSNRAQMDVTIGNITSEAMNNGGEVATPLPTQEQVIATYGPVEGPQRWAQIQQSIDTGRAIESFRTQSPTDIQSALDALRPTPGSPTFETEQQIYQAAQQAAQHLLEQRRSDPAAYALQYFPSVAAAARQGTQQYYAALDRAYEQLGINTSTAPMLTHDAAQEMVQQYKTMNPSQRLAFLRDNYAGLGPERFERFVSSMEGTTAQEDANIYTLLRTYPTPNGRWSNIFREILEGREDMRNDPARRPNPELLNRSFRREALSAITSLNSDASRAIQEGAAALYVSRGGNPTVIDSRLYQQSLRDVLGGSLPVNMTRGVVRDYTILPPGVSEQGFRNWMERQTWETLTLSSVERRPPRLGDLRTLVPSQDIIDHGVYVMVAPGRYMIKMDGDGRPLMTSTGHPFIVNLHTRGENGRQVQVPQVGGR